MTIAPRGAEHALTDVAWGLPEPRPEPWSSGSWSLERRGDELADIRFDGTIVLRMVRAVARDRDWNTVPVDVTAVRATDTALEFDVRMVGFGADLSATMRVDARPALTVSLEGTSATDFERNRLGLVVLHPPTVAGAPLAVTHADGSRQQTAFPLNIAPHQPALDIVGLEWTTDGVSAQLEFEGDVFEMEDQRNWTDASFKTYSTPLALPFPVLLPAGSTFAQAMTLAARRVETSATREDGPLRLVERGAMPHVFVGASTAPGSSAHGPPSVGVLVELDSRAANAPAALARAATAGLPLDVRLVVETADDVARLLDLTVGARVVRLGVFSAKTHVTEPSLWAALKTEVERRGLIVELVAGARSHFTELNRSSDRLPADAPAVTISVTSEMHAVERAQIVESLAMQTVVLENALRIANGRPVHVGPVTLRPRLNAVATTPPAPEPDHVDDGYGPERVPGSTDPRQGSAAVGAWTVASVAALAGASSVCYFEEWGPRGVVGTDGRLTPAGEALALVHPLAGRRMFVADAAREGTALLAAASPDEVTVIAANLTAHAHDIAFEGDGIVGSIRVEPFSVATARLAGIPDPVASNYAGLH